MPPKPEEAKTDADKKKLPPPKPKIYTDENEFKKVAKTHLKTVDMKFTHGPDGKPKPEAPKAAPKEILKDKDGKIFVPLEPEHQYVKDDCKKYIELCANTWLIDADIEEFWLKIERTKDKDGKPLETVGRKSLKNFVLQRTYDKGCILKSRLDLAAETTPVLKPLERYETVLLDFHQNAAFSDITLLNKKTNASYK